MKRALFLIFCLSVLTGTQAGAQDIVKVVLMPGVQLFPIATMEMQGIDKKYNIAIDKRQVVSADALYTTLRAGEVDIGFASWSSAALFRSKGSPLVNVYPMIRFYNDMLVKKDSPMKSFSDLKGKRIGLFGGPAAGTSTLFRFECIKWFGFDPDKDSKVQYGAAPLLKALADKGELDAVFLIDPVSTIMLEKGEYRPIGEIGKIYEDKTGVVLLHVCVTAHENFSKKKPDALKRFLKAYKESVVYFKAHPEIFPRLAAETTEIKTEARIKLMKERVDQSLFTARWDKDLIQQNIKFGEQLGATLGERFWPGVPPGTFSLEYAPN